MPSLFIHVCIPDVGTCVCAVPEGVGVERGQGCIVALRHEQELGIIKAISHPLPSPPLAPSGALGQADFVRPATPADMERATSNDEIAAKVMDIFQQHAEKRNLPVHPMKSHFSFRREKLTLWVFSEEKGIVLQPISEVLQRQFSTHVETRLAGRREEAAALGGLGHCGRPLCCASWFKRFDALHDHDTAPSAQHASFLVNGLCGCTRCCLAFEESQ